MTKDSMEHLTPQERDRVRELEKKSLQGAQEYLDAAVAFYRDMEVAGEKEAAAYADFHTAVANFYLCKWSEALFHCQRAIVEFTKDENWYRLCMCNNLFGIIFANQGDMALAINRFSETIVEADKHEMTYVAALARNNYAESCYVGGEYETIIRATEEAKELFRKSADNPGWERGYCSSLTQQVRAYLKLEQDENTKKAMGELLHFHEKHLMLTADLDESICRLFYDVRFHPKKAQAELGETIQHFDEAPDRNSYIYWIITLMDYLRKSDRLDLLTHVLDVMEKDMEKTSFPFFQLLLSKYRLDLLFVEHRPQNEIYEQCLKRLYLADQEQKQMTQSLKYFIQMQEKLDQNRKKAEEAEAAAKTDTLTGIGNRRAYEEKGQKLLYAAMDHAITFGVEILDIDHFKTINDTYGHEAGDHALQKLARVLAKNSDDHCFSYRLGGDEFVIVYYNMGEDAILQHAKTIQEDLAKCGDDPGCPDLTISQGICYGIPASEEDSLSQFLKQADDCLYQSKQGGRNMIRSCKLVSGKYRFS